MNSQQLYGIDAKARRFVELACVLFLAACVLWLVMDLLAGTFGLACPHKAMRMVAIVLFVIFMVSVAAKLIWETLLCFSVDFKRKQIKRRYRRLTKQLI